MSVIPEKTTKERIQQKRMQFGYTQKTVANYCKVSVSTVKNWESGDSHPTAPEIISLAKLFRTSPNYLLVFDDDSLFILDDTTFEEEQLLLNLHEYFKQHCHSHKR